jgi:hypothetical protein
MTNTPYSLKAHTKASLWIAIDCLASCRVDAVAQGKGDETAKTEHSMIDVDESGAKGARSLHPDTQ